jgi:MFS family permease
MFVFWGYADRLLDSTIIATLATPISDSFNSFTLISWIASAYLIANAALQPLSGKLTDIFGRRAGLIFSNVFFLAGNLICGLAQSSWVMILGRVVAGMGGGGLMAISTFVASDLVPLRKRGLIQGIGNVCYGTGAGLGGVYGGWINDVRGWRLAFLIQLPLIAVSAVLVAITVKIPVKEKEMSKLKRIDYAGSITLVLSLVLLLLGLNSGGNIVPWTHPLVLACIPLSIVFFIVFIYIEARVASEPIIPVHLLLHRTVACACLTNWFTTMATFVFIYYVPIYFQVRGFSTTQSGLRIIPNSIGASIGSLGTGLIMKATGRYYILNAFIESLLLLGAILIAILFGRNTPDVPAYIALLLGGLGYGSMLTVTLLALIAAVDHKYQAVVTSASYAFRSTGATIGITVASAVFQNILKAQLWGRFGDDPHAGEIIGRLRDSIEEIRRLPPQYYDGAMESYMFALKGVWYTALGLGAMGVIVSFGMREHTLYTNLARK